MAQVEFRSSEKTKESEGDHSLALWKVQGKLEGFFESAPDKSTSLHPVKQKLAELKVHHSILGLYRNNGK